VFKYLKINEGKGFIIAEGEYTTGWSGQFISVAFINVYSPYSNNENLYCGLNYNVLRKEIITWCGVWWVTLMRFGIQVKEGLG